LPRYWERLTRCPLSSVSVNAGAATTGSSVVPGSRYGLVASVLPTADVGDEPVWLITRASTTTASSPTGTSITGLGRTRSRSPFRRPLRTAM